VKNITKAAAHIIIAAWERVLLPSGNCVQLNDLELLTASTPLGNLDVGTIFSSMQWLLPLLTA
jgi:hypothetical protein